MNPLESLSESLESLAAGSASRLFHVFSSMGGRSALSFDGKRLLVTAFQAEEGEMVPILAPGGKELEAAVVGFDPAQGLAVLELPEAVPAASWPLAASLPGLGSLVLVVAYPSPEGPEARLDTVRFAGGDPAGEGYIQTDGAAFPGFAGAALVSPSGDLAGFVAANRPGNRGYAIPALKAKALAEAIAERGFPGRAWLGVATIPVEPPAAWKTAVGGSETALLVTAVEEGSPAATAAIMVGDLFITVDGFEVHSPMDLREALGRATPGKSLKLGLFRGGQRVEVTVVPAKAPVERGTDVENGSERPRRGPGWRHFLAGYGRGHGRGHGPGWQRDPQGGRNPWDCCGDH
jgi:S1-C subfamily serine protease